MCTRVSAAYTQVRSQCSLYPSPCHVTAAEGNISHFHNVNTGHSTQGPQTSAYVQLGRISYS
jgi:hypothetical protein